MDESTREPNTSSSVDSLLNGLRRHDFQPVDARNFTIDRMLGEDGIADLDDPDWRVRLITVRDLLRAVLDGDAPEDALTELRDGLRDNDPHVRYVSATVLGILGTETSSDGATREVLERVVRTDPNDLVRAQAVMALGQHVASESLPLLEATEADDDRDVSHQSEIAVNQIRTGMGATDALREAYRTLDPETFGRVTAGSEAPQFTLPDTDGATWTLDDLHDPEEWLVLIWVFADWCPVCHREFDELLELRGAFDEAGVAVATIECHDRYRGRVMVGKELDPEYWFADESFQEVYTDEIWWPHLLDRAGAVGAKYGVDPMAFAVHAEYINRPGTFIIDPDGTVRFAYVGTFWGDRPSIEETLEMIRTETFTFEHPERRQHPEQ